MFSMDCDYLITVQLIQRNNAKMCYQLSQCKKNVISMGKCYHNAKIC